MGEQATGADESKEVRGDGARSEIKATPPRWRSRAVVGLLLLTAVAAGLAIRASWRQAHPDRNVVAAYDGGFITREALLNRWRNAPADERAVMGTPEGIDLTIRSMAIHAVTERWARERRLDVREMFTRAMREATQEIGLHDVERRLHESEVRVEEGEIQQYFDANREAFKDQTLTQAR